MAGRSLLKPKSLILPGGVLPQGQIAKILRSLDLRIPKTEKKIIPDASVLTTGASPFTLFNVTGDVFCQVVATVQTLMVSTAGTGTLAVGVTGATAKFLKAVTVNATNLVAGSAWAYGSLAAPTLKADLFDQGVTNYEWVLIAGGADILATIATNSMTAGAITFYCTWRPLSADGLVAAT